MYYGEIKNFDIANGLGVRVTLFVSGCRNHCKGCFQPQTWSFDYGHLFTDDVENALLDKLNNEHIRGLTLLGGEPFEPENQRRLVPLLQRVRTELPDKDIWCFTGFRLEDELLRPSRARCDATDAMLALIDVLVDGRFDESKKNLSLSFRGSENQRVLDLKATLAQGKPVLLPLKR